MEIGFKISLFSLSAWHSSIVFSIKKIQMCFERREAIKEKERHFAQKKNMVPISTVDCKGLCELMHTQIQV